MFKVFDMDGDGFISAEEFKWTMMNLGNQLTEKSMRSSKQLTWMATDKLIWKVISSFFSVWFSTFSCPVFDYFIGVWSFRLFSLPVSFVCTCDITTGLPCLFFGVHKTKSLCMFPSHFIFFYLVYQTLTIEINRGKTSIHNFFATKNLIIRLLQKIISIIITLKITPSSLKKVCIKICICYVCK